MSAINLNLTGIDRPKFEVLPEGDYVLQLSDLEVKPGKSNSDNLVAHCVYEVVEPSDFSGRKVKYWQVLNPKPQDAGYLKVWVEALLGEPVESDLSIEPDDLIGRHCEAYIKHESRNDDKDGVNAVISYFKLPFEV